MNHQTKENIRNDYIYGVIDKSGERNMPTLEELTKEYKVPSSTIYRLSSKEDWKIQRRKFQSQLRKELDQAKNDELKETLFKCERFSLDLSYKIFNKAELMIDEKITPNGLASISNAVHTAQKIYMGRNISEPPSDGDAFQEAMALLDQIQEFKRE